LAVISLPVSAFNQPKSYPLEISESQNFPGHVWESITTGLTKASQAFLDGIDGAD
jgi:hypothetical protein